MAGTTICVDGLAELRSSRHPDRLCDILKQHGRPISVERDRNHFDIALILLKVDLATPDLAGKASLTC